MHMQPLYIYIYTCIFASSIHSHPVAFVLGGILGVSNSDDWSRIAANKLVRYSSHISLFPCMNSSGLKFDQMQTVRIRWITGSGRLDAGTPASLWSSSLQVGNMGFLRSFCSLWSNPRSHRSHSSRCSKRFHEHYVQCNIQILIDWHPFSGSLVFNDICVPFFCAAQVLVTRISNPASLLEEANEMTMETKRQRERVVLHERTVQTSDCTHEILLKSRDFMSLHESSAASKASIVVPLLCSQECDLLAINMNNRYKEPLWRW